MVKSAAVTLNVIPFEKKDDDKRKTNGANLCHLNQLLSEMWPFFAFSNVQKANLATMSQLFTGFFHEA